MTESLPRLRRAGYLTISLVLIYLAVGLFAAACPAEFALDSQGHHHHGAAGHGMVSHSLLCAWSCQVSPLLGLTTAVPLSGPILVVIGFLMATNAATFITTYGPIAARAPPVCCSRPR